MNKKVWTRFIIGAIGILIICIIIAVYFFNTRITKQENVAKDFISLLAKNKMIHSNADVNKIKFDIVEQNDGDKKFYRVTSKNYGIDLDSKLNVIGFNYILANNKEVEISVEESRHIAEYYVSILSKGNYEFKSYIDQSNNNLSYYGYIFTRYKNGYPFYNDEIMVQIDKNSGYLAAYSNSKSQGNPKTIVININSNDAEKITLKNFNKSNISGVIDSKETYVAYCDNEDNKDTQLCYVVTISGKSVDNKEVKWKYFISTDTGKILNSIKDNVSKTSVK